MYREGIIPTKSGAALMAEMEQQPLGIGLEGGDRQKTITPRRLLKEEEEEFLIWHCDILQCTTFPLSVKDITIVLWLR